MSKIRSQRNRSTEWKLRAALVQAGIKGWSLGGLHLQGKPDFVFANKKIVVFVDGCFWHGCPFCYRRPKSRQAYWDNKVSGNIKRDKSKRASLRRAGWRVIRIWECALRKNPLNCLQRIQRVLND
jgi:DNA mismatch endonuclease (patch repair protein)